MPFLIFMTLPLTLPIFFWMLPKLMPVLIPLIIMILLLKTSQPNSFLGKLARRQWPF